MSYYSWKLVLKTQLSSAFHSWNLNPSTVFWCTSCYHQAACLFPVLWLCNTDQRKLVLTLQKESSRIYSEPSSLCGLSFTQSWRVLIPKPRSLQSQRRKWSEVSSKDGSARSTEHHSVWSVSISERRKSSSPVKSFIFTLPGFHETTLCPLALPFHLLRQVTTKKTCTE